MDPKMMIVRAMVAACLVLMPAVPAGAKISVQCRGDVDGDAVPDQVIPSGYPDAGQPNPEYDPDVRCMHLAAGDGYVTMADRRDLYFFGFSDVTGIPEGQVMEAGMLAQTWPAPTIALNEGEEFYLNLSNVGMMMRPDLFDPHTVHWHGFPEASSIFDGLPESAMSINMGSTLTYYYKVNDPGTYMYHCHVEATEHMQMGMLGNLYVRPAQDGTSYFWPPAPDPDSREYTTFAYNDNDGSTGYDVDFAIQIGSFDSDFHDASETVQPLPFALMVDDYPMLNGRGYPDTVYEGSLLPPPDATGLPPDQSVQTEHSLIRAVQGQRVLLRLSNLNVTRYYTLASLGIPMLVVGRDAKLLRGPTGRDLYFRTSSIRMGGGESADIILETGDIDPGTYFLYTTNLNYLNNDQEEFGGMMTEVIIEPAP